MKTWKRKLEGPSRGHPFSLEEASLYPPYKEKGEPTPKEREPSSHLPMQVGGDHGVHEIVLAGIQAPEPAQHVVGIHIDSDVLHVHVLSELRFYSD